MSISYARLSSRWFFWGLRSLGEKYYKPALDLVLEVDDILELANTKRGHGVGLLAVGQL
ncbi:MAG: hypothetical protein GTO41_03975, partial [Burkholderiales bacterium]|nr:hypothetical protein [Burkholderiales bacterium]